MSEFLESQCWPHEQVRLVLMDTSQNDTFFARVRQWIGQCDYPDVRHFRRQVGVPGLADKPRAESVSAVRRSMARIYNELARSVSTPFVWILEDDVFPEPGICEQLIRGFDTRTASVSAPYRSRFHNGYVAWDHFHRTIQRKGTGLESIGGNSAFKTRSSSGLPARMGRGSNSPAAFPSENSTQLNFLRRLLP
jgi:hypothetical protein